MDRPVASAAAPATQVDAAALGPLWSDQNALGHWLDVGNIRYCVTAHHREYKWEKTQVIG